MQCQPGLRPRQVRPRRLADLPALVSTVRWTGAEPAGTILTGITHDAGAVRPGDLYAALAGAHVHGARFAAAAAATGAVGVLTDAAGAELAADAALPTVVVSNPRGVLGRIASWVYDDPSSALRLLAVTGTNGKTTTAYLIEAGLRAAGQRTALIGTIETRIGEERMPSLHTTPEATDLQALFAVMRERHVSSAAMEVSSHALALGRVEGTRFAAGVFTNLSQDHLDFHHDMETYFAAKATLFTPSHAERGVVNLDDSFGQRLAAAATVPVTTVSAAGRPEADWRGTDVVIGARESTFTLVGPAGVRLAGAVRLPGEFNLVNAMLAISSLVVAGIPTQAATAGVAELAAVPGRMERVEAGQPYLAVVDYAHTPLAVATLLATLRAVTAGRLVVVLGCGGDRDRGKRRLMGVAAVHGADLAVLTSDNPRSEDPVEILAQMRSGLSDGDGAYVVEPDRGAAIRLAVAVAQPGDTVVVAGKGHEQGQELGDGAVVPFDDRAVLTAAIRELQ